MQTPQEERKKTMLNVFLSKFLVGDDGCSPLAMPQEVHGNFARKLARRKNSFWSKQKL